MSKYYEAYDERYKKIHGKNLLWFKPEPTPEVLDWAFNYSIPKDEAILEIGCGEGRDVIYLVNQGYKVVGCDISNEAIKTCKKLSKEQNLEIEWFLDDFAKHIDKSTVRYNWIYSVSTLHMLVDEDDRYTFLSNIYKVLNPGGKLLLVNKGDGESKMRTSKEDAFELVERFHYSDREPMKLEATSYIKITWEEHLLELENIGFVIEKHLNTKNENYDACMTVYAAKRNTANIRSIKDEI